MALVPSNETAMNSEGLPAVHILVMGLTGSGKSTFIMRATGDTSIETGEGLESVTTVVRSYQMKYKGHEVFLIDSPGFDDDKLCDDDVLSKIADFINNIHNLGWKIGGIIYIHDISKKRMGNVGGLNIRVLETLTGAENWHNITLVTSQWGESKSPSGELLREKQLQENPKFWAAMREAKCQARMCRFDNTEAGAKEIIDWHIEKSFVPRLSKQMVDEGLKLGEADAGQVIKERYEKVFLRNGWTDKLARMNERMNADFQGQDMEMAVSSLLHDLHRLEQKQMLQSVGKWVVRLGLYGGAMVATILTENPAAFRAAVAAAGPLEMKFRTMKENTKNRTAEVRNSIASTVYYGQLEGPVETD